MTFQVLASCAIQFACICTRTQPHSMCNKLRYPSRTLNATAIELLQVTLNPLVPGQTHAAQHVPLRPRKRNLTSPSESAANLGTSMCDTDLFCGWGSLSSRWCLRAGSRGAQNLNRSTPHPVLRRAGPHHRPLPVGHSGIKTNKQ